MIDPTTKKFAKCCGTLGALLGAVAFFGNMFAGYSEYGEISHSGLPVTGLPFVSMAAGVIGLVHWPVIAEVNAGWEACRKSRHD